MNDKTKTFVNVLEKVLKKVRGIRTLEIEMALEFPEERETVWHNPLIARIPTMVMNFTKVINCRSGLKGLRIAKTAITFAVFACLLSVFRHGFVIRRVVVHHVC